MKQKLIGFIKLTRFSEITFAIFLSLLAAYLASNSVDALKLLLVTVANYSIVMFSFMINDVEDAEDDSMDPKKAKRNPVSADLISKRLGYFYCSMIAIISLIIILFATNTKTFIVAMISLVLGFLYSWNKIRLKSKPILDIISHGLFLGGLTVIIPFVAFKGFSKDLVVPFFLALVFSVDGALYNQIRDYKVDSEAKLRNTSQIIGLEKTKKITSVLRGLGGIAIILLAITTYQKFKLLPLVLFAILMIGIWFWEVKIKKGSVHRKNFGLIVYLFSSIAVGMSMLIR